MAFRSEATPSTTARFISATISLRPAGLTDLPALARISARAFHDDVLFGHIIHPFRHKYTSHMSRYWLSRMLIAYFDWSHRLIVAVAQPAAGDGGREVPVGVIHWSRIALPSQNEAAGWGLRCCDTRRVLKRVVAAVIWLASRTIWQNKAADPAWEGVIEASEASGCLDHIWDASKGRLPSWYVDSMAVDPEWQGRGVGRMLVEEGLRLAEREGVSASVIAADGKEEFYRRCGFVTGPVGRSGMGDPERNPLWAVPGGLIFFQEAPGHRQASDDEAEEVEECVRRLKADLEGGWRSSWLETGVESKLGIRSQRQNTSHRRVSTEGVG